MSTCSEPASIAAADHFSCAVGAPAHGDDYDDVGVDDTIGLLQRDSAGVAGSKGERQASACSS